MKYSIQNKEASKKKSNLQLSYTSKLRIKNAVKYGLILTIGIFIGSALIGSSTPSTVGDTILDTVTNTINQVKTVNIPPASAYKYSVEILSIEPDSISGYEPDGISDIELQITNNRDESITLDFERYGIVYNDGQQISLIKESWTRIIPSKYICSNILSGDQFTLLPNGKNIVHLAFDKIDKNKDPKLIISFVENPTGKADSYGDEMSRGKREGNTKEFIIPLALYL